jgi:hypothetical protein
MMKHPQRGLIAGTGCHDFEASCENAEGHPLDRTPLYAAMAQLERSCRQLSGVETPVKLTIAQMILIFDE